MILRLSWGLAAGLCLALTTLTPRAEAQAISKTVTLVVPYAAGGGTDTVARLIGEMSGASSLSKKAVPCSSKVSTGRPV